MLNIVWSHEVNPRFHSLYIGKIETVPMYNINATVFDYVYTPTFLVHMYIATDLKELIHHD